MPRHPHDHQFPQAKYLHILGKLRRDNVAIE